MVDGLLSALWRRVVCDRGKAPRPIRGGSGGLSPPGERIIHPFFVFLGRGLLLLLVLIV
jgi:hypothetical protein